MDAPCLPQHDPNPEQRRTGVATAEKLWPVTYDRFVGLAQSPVVPPSDHPDGAWLAEVAAVLVRIGLNAGAADRSLEALHPESPRHSEVLELIRDARRGGIHAAFGFLESLVQGGEDGEPASRIEDYDALFRHIPLPACAAEVRDDLWFARMRVAGPNPMSIARVDALPTRLVLDEDDVARAMAVYAARGIDTSGGTLAAALADGRAFVTDYAALDGIPGGVWAGRTKHLYAPVTLFLTVGEARTLVPVAIGTGRQTTTPADADRWQNAKSMASVADGNVHQAVVHLGHTHLVLEACVLAARRNLAPSHPIARLLAPHFEGTLYINDAADLKLASPGGGVDAVMGGSIGFSRAAAVQGARTWSFRGTMFDRALRSRGVDDRTTLPDFPYRDDGTLLHGAILRWVEGYLRTWYRSNADVASDLEVRAMFRWLGSPDGGRLSDVPVPVTIVDLVDAVTHIVFTGSAQHAAVNFPQDAIMAYAPAYPLAGYSDGSGEWLPMLPPLALAHYQATLGTLLGSVRHTRLGDYPRGLFHNFAGDPRIDPHLEAFQNDLAAIERTIAQRNLTRPVYPYLLPSLVPQSTNI